jgi:hypothetical protein
MTNQNNAAQAAERDPLSDEHVNAVVRQHGYDSPESVIAQLAQWIGLHGGQNSVTLLMYEAHKALSKLRAEGVQASEPVADTVVRQCPRCTGNGTILRLSGNGPDAYDVQEECPHCEGSGVATSAPVAGEAHTGSHHTLKTDPEVFQAVLSGAKTFEVRLNDRGYAVGDALFLRETRFTGAEMRAGAPLVYTGRECHRVVSHVLTGYGLTDGWCCLSFAAPQASEAVRIIGVDLAQNGIAVARNAALDEAATLLENHIPVSHFIFFDSPEGAINRIANRSGPEVIWEAVAAIRALKTQAEKDVDGSKEHQ